jgi:alkanesulfonate monooxygenase SsuD/methylene tetrahydromethanopterin reductase-like flavin-dependent oxidoreductase (luciferase family)
MRTIRRIPNTGADSFAMVTFDPTAAPAGHLARLGVVLDVREPIDRVRGLAVLCDRAGIDVVWLADRAFLDDPASWADPTEVATIVAPALRRARLGALVPDGTLTPPGTHESLRWHADPSPIADGDRPRRSVLMTSLDETADAFTTCDDVCLAAWRSPDLETTSDEVRAEAAEAGRDPGTLGVAALLPVSIGRTQAEADARVAIDPLLGRLGHPAETGIFGTLEECQDRVIALAHAGITDLRCVLPATNDVHDVLAQLTAMTVGTTEVLVPGSLRSPAPPPPDGWGGRADVPMRPQVSGGSRRR